MERSLHNFFFVSFDPVGLITVDKPPLALWLQALVAFLFGFHPLSLLVPEALCGAATVSLVYLALARPWGRAGAFGGALAVAVFPAFVAVARDNLPDPLLLFLLTAAAFCVQRATARGRLSLLLLSAVLVALAFNTKTLAAYIPLPAFALTYLLLAPKRLSRRLLELLLAAFVAGAISFSWILAVELVPPTSRPYVGGSTNNSELGLTFNYNGFGRLTGEEGAPAEIPYRNGAATVTLSHLPATTEPPIYRPLNHHGLVPIRSAAGAAGPLRLFNQDLGNQDSWLLPAALLTLLAFGVAAFRHRERRFALSQGTREGVASLGAFGGWFLLEAVVLSGAGGIVHPYYTAALAPGLGGLLGAAAGAADRLPRAPALALLALAGSATLALQGLLLASAGLWPWLLPAALGALCLAVAGRRFALSPTPLAAALLALLSIAPAAFAATTWEAPVQGTFPAAGPAAAAGAGGVGLEGEDRTVVPNLVRFLQAHASRRGLAVATVSAVSAAPLILLGLRAAALAGYGGTDPAVGARRLAEFVRHGKLRYVLLGGPYSERGGNGATAAALAVCRPLPSAAWVGPPLTPYSFVLYDCAGRARALLSWAHKGNPKLAHPAVHGGDSWCALPSSFICWPP